MLDEHSRPNNQKQVDEAVSEQNANISYPGNNQLRKVLDKEKDIQIAAQRLCKDNDMPMIRAW